MVLLIFFLSEVLVALKHQTEIIIKIWMKSNDSNVQDQIGTHINYNVKRYGSELEFNRNRGKLIGFGTRPGYYVQQWLRQFATDARFDHCQSRELSEHINSKLE